VLALGIGVGADVTAGLGVALAFALVTVALLTAENFPNTFFFFPFSRNARIL
jgi:hypothetical protein